MLEQARARGQRLPLLEVHEDVLSACVRHGEAELDNSRVIAEVNRYRPGRIVLIDRSLGDEEVTARFRLDRLDDAIAQIHEVFRARIRTLPGGLVLVG